MAIAAENILRRLQQETRIPQQRVGRHRLRRALRDGTLPRGRYADWLAQRFLIHRALEKQAATLADRTPVVGRVMEHQRDLLAKLRGDLTFFNVNPATVRPGAAAVKLIASIEDTARFSPVALLGICYVLHVTGYGPLHLDKGCHCSRGRGCALTLADEDELVSRLEMHALVAAARMTYALSAELEDGVFPHVVPGHSSRTTTALLSDAG